MIDWISVLDELPAYHVAVLLCDCNSKEIGIGYLIPNPNQWMTDYRVDEKCITHWAELPELPEPTT